MVFVLYLFNFICNPVPTTTVVSCLFLLLIVIAHFLISSLHVIRSPSVHHSSLPIRRFASVHHPCEFQRASRTHFSQRLSVAKPRPWPAALEGCASSLTWVVRTDRGPAVLMLAHRLPESRLLFAHDAMKVWVGGNPLLLRGGFLLVSSCNLSKRYEMPIHLVRRQGITVLLYLVSPNALQ
jgi:hypothetical protein